MGVLLKNAANNDAQQVVLHVLENLYTYHVHTTITFPLLTAKLIDSLLLELFPLSKAFWLKPAAFSRHFGKTQGFTSEVDPVQFWLFWL